MPIDHEPANPPLPDRIRARILEHGPITFAEFMEAALYDPEGGFYSRLPVGRSEEQHFATSPHVSPAFAMLVAAGIGDMWELLGRPDPFALVEVGAGDGTLAGQLLEFLPAPAVGNVHYVAVERGGEARRHLEEMVAGAAGRLEVRSSMDEVPRDLVGVVVANELLDNLPFHRVRGTDAGIVELHVAVTGDRFNLVEGPLSDPALAQAGGMLDPGKEAVIQLEAGRFVERAAGLLSRGYVLIVDYGFTGGDRAAAPHAYRRHRVEEDVLEDPGSRDITAGVDFDRLADLAGEAGHAIWGPVAQRDLLIALGFRRLDDGARQRQVAAMAAGNGIEASRIYAARSRATPLVDPSGLGGLHVLCLGVGGVPPPAAMVEATGR